MILRRLFPDYEWIQSNRAMSWQFAGAYDLLAANGQIATHYIKNNRKERLLSAREKSLNKDNKVIVEKLSKILDAVTHNNDRQAGDILVKRPIDAECEGHVMTIVDPFPNPKNTNEVIIVELTQYSGFNGARNGLVWRKVDLTNCGVTRILRPVLNNNDVHIIVSQNNNNNIAPQQPPRVNQNAFNFDNCGLYAEQVEKAKAAFQQFKNAGDLSLEAKIVSAQRVSSFEVDFIIFVEDKGIQKVIKIMLGEDAGEEKDFFKKDLTLVNKINQLAHRNNVSIPKLIISNAMIDSNGMGAYLQEKAKGKLLVGVDIKNMSDNDVKTMFKSIGLQSGNLDKLLIDNNMPFIHHTDSHSQNLFFDAQTQQFSWIDTAGIANNYDQRQISTSPDEGSLFTIKVINTFINNPIMSNEANQEQGPDAGHSIAILNAGDDDFRRYYNNMNAQKIDKLKKEIRNGGSYDYSVEAIKADIKTILLASKKFAIALKSLGEGYVLGNPSAKSFVNNLLKNSEVAKYLKYANDLRAIIDKPAEAIFDLSIR
jgi:hypothetical protein